MTIKKSQKKAYAAEELKQRIKMEEVIRHPLYPNPVRVQAVKPLEGYHVRITFTDGTVRDIDLQAYLWGPVFKPVRDNPKLFRQVYVDPIARTLAWPGELDLDPDVLYYDGNPPWSKPGKGRVKKPTSRSRTPSSTNAGSRSKAPPKKETKATRHPKHNTRAKSR
jgi:hypothetical protein